MVILLYLAVQTTVPFNVVQTLSLQQQHITNYCTSKCSTDYSVLQFFISEQTQIDLNKMFHTFIIFIIIIKYI